MNLNLATMYGTPGAEAVAAEEQEKVAQTELFCKLAADNGIDLNQFNDEQIQELWNSTFTKTAEEEKDKKENPFAKKEEGKEHEGKESKKEEEKEHEKEAAAQAEFEATKVAQAKLAEADYLGRLMAHAYVNELGQIGSAMGQDKEAAAKEASKASELLARFKGHAGGAAEKLKEHAGKLKGHAEQGAEKAKSHVKSHPASYAGGAGAAGGAAAGYAAGHHKKASALDEIAAELAVEKAAAAGWNAEEAAERLGAALTLGSLSDSEKVASAANYGEAREIRALELLEAVGYPINWDAA